MFEGDLKNGQGVQAHKKYGLQFVGNYVNNLKQGKGTFFWTSGKYSGRIFTGMFDKNDIHGQGEMLYTDGTKYIGDWKKKKRNGQGKMVD